MPITVGLRARASAIMLVTLVPLLATAAAPAAANTTITITGVVTYSETGRPAGVGEVSIGAYGSPGFGPTVTVMTDAEGRYSLTVPVAHSWDLKFDYLPSGRYADEWFTNAPAPQVASGVWGIGSEFVADAELELGGGMSGTLLLPNGTPAANGSVTVERFFDYQNYPWHAIEYTTDVDAQGRWEFTGLPAADYRITFWSGSDLPYRYLTSAWQDRYDSPQGDRVTVQAGQTVTGLDKEFFDRTTIGVRFDCSLCGTGMPYALVVRFALEFRADPTAPWTTVEVLSTWGEFMTLGAREPGEYRVLGSFSEGAEWGYGYTQSVVLAEGDEVSLPAASLGHPPVDRLFGADRFETSADIVRASHPDETDLVYIANGTTFADALSAGPAAAANGAPLLLVTTTSVPPATMDELRRLKPTTIVIVGGLGAVSAGVAAELGTLARVERREGSDRYDTSRSIATAAFPGGSHIVYIATGTSFPDALSAGAVAGALGAPLVTVNGAASGIDTPTRDLLIAFGAREIRVVGGTGAVSAGVAAALEAVPGVERVVRYAGADRYETSLAVSAVLTDPPAILLAVGTSFADALGGGPYAASTGSPLIVVPASCVPAAVIERIRATTPNEVVLLGGEGVLHVRVESLTPCA